MTLVDCVSSLGGIEFRTDDWQVDIAWPAAQKCLGGPPGITLMTVSDAAWERIRSNPAAPRASFLSMLDWKEQWIDGEKFPFTPSVVDMHGIEACCDVVLDEGLDDSIARHERCGAACRAGVRAMGLELWPRSEEVAAACVTAIAVPEGLTDVQVRAHCRERYGVMISGGQGAGNLVRIGHMGPTAQLALPRRRPRGVGRTLADLGARRSGTVLEAALEVLSETAPAIVDCRRWAGCRGAAPWTIVDVARARRRVPRSGDGRGRVADAYRPARRGRPSPVPADRALPYDKTYAQGRARATHTPPGGRAPGLPDGRPGLPRAVPFGLVSSTLRGTRRGTATTRSSGPPGSPAPTAGSRCTASPTRERPSSSRQPGARRASWRSAPG